MPRYRYTGDVEVAVPGVGVVRPKQIINTKINHPLFKRVRKTKKSRKKK